MKTMAKKKRSDEAKYWQDMIDILSRMKRFQKAVVKARRKLGIPSMPIRGDSLIPRFRLFDPLPPRFQG